MGTFVVTGVAGFIASRVAGLLLEHGHRVIGVDNLNDAYDVRLKERRLAALSATAAFSLDIADVARESDVRRLAKEIQSRTDGVDGIINLAGRAGVRASLLQPELYYETNLGGTLRMLELCKALSIRKFVLASSSSVYGARDEGPFSEGSDTSRPLSPYAASKKAAEELCFTYHQLYGIDVSVLRYFTVYGPAGRPDMTPFRFVQWTAENRPVIMFGDGSQSRDFTYVDDIARGTIAALRPLGYEIINLGSDRPLALSALLCAVEKACGRRATVRHSAAHPGDVPRTWANVEKARSLLGWSAQIAFADGVEAMVRWYMDNREWARHIETGSV